MREIRCDENGALFIGATEDGCGLVQGEVPSPALYGFEPAGTKRPLNALSLGLWFTAIVDIVPSKLRPVKYTLSMAVEVD